MNDTARELVDNARRIVAFSGAGLSAESGIPTFRDPDTQGFWVNYDPRKLASPEGFAADADLVYRWYSDRRKNLASVEPNAAHRALAARPDIVNVTQNIDDLLIRAGAKTVIRLHGTLSTDRCNGRCVYEEAVDIADPPPLRSCPHCGERLRPAVVWFGESLPGDEWARAEQHCVACDLLLVIGTAAEVYPAAGLIQLAKATGAAIIVINTKPSEASDPADVELIGPAGEILPRLIPAPGGSPSRS